MIQAPIFHVNGDDPRGLHPVARLAFAFRQEFNKDVVIDPSATAAAVTTRATTRASPNLGCMT